MDLHIVWKLLKKSHVIFFLILAYSTNCCLVTLFDYKKKWTIFGIYNEFLSTKNVNVARYARNL